LKVTISPNTLNGTVKAPPSKSMTHRYLIITSLADGDSLIEGPLRSDDTYATVEGLKKLGISIDDLADNWKIKGGSLSPSETVIDCRESGTTLRFLIGLCSLLEKHCTLTGSPSLIRRPNKPLLSALEKLGVHVQSIEGFPPITVRGRLKGGEAEIPGDISSQFISSIILAAPYAEKPLTLRIQPELESKPYVHLTLDAIKNSGVVPEYSDNLGLIKIPTGKYNPTRIKIEGDWSSASYMLAAGAVAGKIHIDNLDITSKQADIEIIRILDKMGAYVKIKGNRVTTEKSNLSGIDLDLRNCPDLFPMVACLCSVAEGSSTLTGLERLKIKESDRLEAMIEGLRKLGIKITKSRETITIKGGTPSGATIDPYNDHRIAMSFAIIANAARGKTTIINPECVSKSYPSFWNDLKQVGAELK
jgi:3-phosphoshikimate 1-carboxyvinyltransferase